MVKTHEELREDIHEDALLAMKDILERHTGKRVGFYAYQNQAMDSSGLGRLKFLLCGEGCTFDMPPGKMPDTATEINWMYQLVNDAPLPIGDW